MLLESDRKQTASPALADERETSRIMRHLAGSIDAAVQVEEPFLHLQLSNVLPAGVYAKMLGAMPVKSDYRPMSGRTKATLAKEGDGARMKIDLFPEFVRHLPAAKANVWGAVGRALCSEEVREALMRRLARGLQRRFGPNYDKVGMYPIPVLTRDVPGYRFDVHPDTHWKGVTVQLYLPPDDSIRHVGTIFYERIGDEFSRALQMSFAPNSGYAFVVDKDTYHSVDTVGPEVKTRDSILLTYFVDETPLQIVRNRGKRLGNFVLNELRSIAR